MQLLSLGFLVLAYFCILSISLSKVQAQEQNGRLRRDLKNKQGGGGNKNGDGGAAGAGLRPTNGQAIFGPEQLAQLSGQGPVDVAVTVHSNSAQRTQVGASSPVINTDPTTSTVNNYHTSGGSVPAGTTHGSNGGTVTSVIVNGEVTFGEDRNEVVQSQYIIPTGGNKKGDKKGGGDGKKVGVQTVSANDRFATPVSTNAKKKGGGGAKKGGVQTISFDDRYVTSNAKKNGGGGQAVSSSGGTIFTQDRLDALQGGGEASVIVGTNSMASNQQSQQFVSSNSYYASIVNSYNTGKRTSAGKKGSGMKMRRLRSVLPQAVPIEEPSSINAAELEEDNEDVELVDIEFRMDTGEEITDATVDEFLEHFNRARELKGNKGKAKGNKNKNQAVYTVAAGPTTSENFVGFTSFANPKNNNNKNKNNNNNNHSLSREQWINQNGVAETKPCVSWDYITDNQRINPSSSDACRDLSNGYPFNGGCCRSYWWLIMDSGGTSNPSVPCVCNQYTRDPSSWTAALQPTNPPTTPPPTTPEPTTPSPTIKPSLAPSPSPSAGPSFASEPVIIDRTEVLTASPPSLDTCFVWDNIQHWNPQAFPELAERTRCTNSDHCIDVANSCCLGAFCLCGIFRDAGNANRECVPLSDGMGMEAYLDYLVAHPNTEESHTDLETEIDALEDELIIDVGKRSDIP